MNDILPPKHPSQQPVDGIRLQTPLQKRPMNRMTPPLLEAKRDAPQPLLEELSPPLLIEESKPRRSRKKIVLWSLVGLIIVVLLAAASVVVWYEMMLQPLSSQSNKTNVKIVNGSSSTQIGALLEQKKIIRSAFAFDVYTRLTNTRMKLQAGTFSFSPSEPVSQIVSQIIAGKVDQFSITFLPGATLAENRAGLIKAGFSAADVDAALNKTYDSPLFTDKPVSADLEGYIYGDTYQFNADATVEQILTRTFDEYYAKITENNLVSGFKSQGLNLYQGITLASIIQREVSREADQKQVAQVFYTRLATNMPLGSDVTYQYAAKKLGVAPSPTLDSPYNTRINAGLPPGPIATPGLSALEAVAAPASGNYVYFLSGDDGVTYFAVTEQEHEANITNHCQIKCATP
jgi:UPF0755 protein